MKDKYDVLKILGEGSFGKCYLMRDRSRRIQVCVKVIKIRNMPAKERDATQMEVDLLRRLCHPNIVRYYDSFMSRNNESLCISMEYCDGGDLDSQITKAGRHLFSEEKILHWFVQMALGLHYMHTNRVLHRDLKTQNVFLLGNGRLVLGDLGISKVLDGTKDFAQTMIGTPYYMSPEIFDNKPYSYKSDVWALGCVLYELTTLNKPFDGKSLHSLAVKIKRGRITPINSKYSRHLRTLIDNMLTKKPDDRPDLDDIIRRPFIQTHIINFFSDIASRPSNAKMGEGTMIVRVAVRGASDGAQGPLSNDQNMLNLRMQLRDVGLTDRMNAALAPATKPTTEVEIRRRQREQSWALRREEENKRMVMSALEKHQKDREARLKNKADASNGVKVSVNKPPVPRQSEMRRNADGERVDRPPSDRSRDSERRQHHYGHRDHDADAAAKARRRREEDEHKAYAEAERDRKEEAERRHREEARIDARKREEARIREEAQQKEQAREQSRKEEKKREEALAMKQRNDLMKAKEDAAARRDAQKERERARQKDAIEQLKRDKVLLDKRIASQARDRVQEEKAADSIFTSPEKAKKEAAEAERGGGASDRERVLQRKREQQQREEEERKSALLRAEEENRSLRERAQDQRKNQYAPTADASVIPGAGGGAKEPSKPPPADAKMLTERLKEATEQNGGSRFDRPAGNRAAPDSGAIRKDYNKADYESSSDEEDLWGAPMTDAQHNAEMEADMMRREQELKAELDIANERCAELQKTLKETLQVASTISADSSSRQDPSMTEAGPADAFDVDDLYGDDSDEEDKDEAPVYSARGVEQVAQGAQRLAVDDADSEGATPRELRPDVAVRAPPYHDLQEASSPVGPGMLGPRAERLRSKLVRNVGQAKFDEAYRLFKEWEGDTVEDGIERSNKAVSILGNKAFADELDNLLFLEQFNDS